MGARDVLGLGEGDVAEGFVFAVAEPEVGDGKDDRDDDGRTVE